jgi:predicted transglutaminase-like cysteine proteinase
MMRRFLPLLVPLFGVMAVAPAFARPPTMPVSGEAFPPPAFQTFCRSQPTLCSTVKGGKVVDLTAGRQSELAAVNAEVNAAVRQRDDAGGGRSDVWEIARTSGDCEDVAIRKKSELLKRGWPASAMLLTVARMPYSDDGHTVLTVRTSDGDLILDSLDRRVRPWSRTNYRYFARQSQDAFGKWVRIN